MAQPIILTYPLVNNTLVAPVQSLSAAGYFQLNGDYVGACNPTPDNAAYPYAPVTIPNMGRTISFTSVGDQSAFTIHIRGEDIYGVFQEEDVTGPNANTVQSTKQYHVIYNISCNGAIDDTSIGTGIGADFGWRMMNIHNTNSQFSIQSNVTGTINYVVTRTAQQLEFPNQTLPINATGFALPTPLSATASDLESVTVPTTGFKLVVSGSGGGTDATGAMTLTIIQQGLK